MLGQLIISLSPQARIEILDRRSRQRISETIESQADVCAVVRRSASHTDVLSVFQRIEDTCLNLPRSYLSVPEEAQPDQELSDTDEPQEHSGAEND